MGRTLLILLLAAGGCARPVAWLTGSASSEPTAARSSDGTPTQGACTRRFGHEMSEGFGRLDGYVWSLVAVGDRSCAGDEHHVHLQVKAHDGIYNIAVTAVDLDEVELLEREVSIDGLPAGWSEGWHPGGRLDYAALGLHARDFRPLPGAAIEATLRQALGRSNHVSIFTTGFGPTGGHLVHRNHGGEDGAIVLAPLSSPQHAFFFHFARQNF